MQKDDVGKKSLNEKELRESMEMCEDIYEYYEVKKHSIDYFDINKHSILFNQPRNIRIESGPVIREKEIVVERVSLMTQIIFFAVCVVLAVFLSKLINGAIIQETKVSGNSMNQTLKDKERVLLNKFVYRFEKPKRYDIVVFSFNNGEHFVKRIIGLPGEKVQIKEGRVFINDQVLLDDPVFEKMNYAGIAEEGIVVERDQYFVLGDNRNHSYDSRYEEIGFINKKSILGKVWLRIFPFTKIGIVK